MEKLRGRLYTHLAMSAWRGEGLSPLNKAIAALIIFTVVIVVVETEPTLYAPLSETFWVFDLTVAFLFLAEYLARLWAMGEDPRYRGLTGRLRYAVTPAAIIDLAAILPFFLGIGGTDSFLLRTLRLLRIFALAKIGRYSEALRHLTGAIVERHREILISVGVAFVVLLASSTVMYLAEGAAQPEAFGSIPRALWWAIATLTTVGYGDVYPITPIGKLFGGMTALAAVGIIAMPTAILAAAFSDAMQRRRAAAALDATDVA